MCVKLVPTGKKTRITQIHVAPPQNDVLNIFALCKVTLIIAMVSLPNVASKGNHYLYTTKYNYVDLNADENGIWAIYTTPFSTHTNVVKV